MGLINGSWTKWLEPEGNIKRIEKYRAFAKDFYEAEYNPTDPLTPAQERSWGYVKEFVYRLEKFISNGNKLEDLPKDFIRDVVVPKNEDGSPSGERQEGLVLIKAGKVLTKFVKYLQEKGENIPVLFSEINTDKGSDKIPEKTVSFTKDTSKLEQHKKMTEKHQQTINTNTQQNRSPFIPKQTNLEEIRQMKSPMAPGEGDHLAMGLPPAPVQMQTRNRKPDPMARLLPPQDRIRVYLERGPGDLAFVRDYKIDQVLLYGDHPGAVDTFLMEVVLPTITLKKGQDSVTFHIGRRTQDGNVNSPGELNIHTVAIPAELLNKLKEESNSGNLDILSVIERIRESDERTRKGIMESLTDKQRKQVKDLLDDEQEEVQNQDGNFDQINPPYQETNPLMEKLIEKNLERQEKVEDRMYAMQEAMTKQQLEHLTRLQEMNNNNRHSNGSSAAEQISALGPILTPVLELAKGHSASPVSEVVNMMQNQTKTMIDQNNVMLERTMAMMEKKQDDGGSPVKDVLREMREDKQATMAMMKEVMDKNNTPAAAQQLPIAEIITALKDSGNQQATQMANLFNTSLSLIKESVATKPQDTGILEIVSTLKEQSKNTAEQMQANFANQMSFVKEIIAARQPDNSMREIAEAVKESQRHTVEMIRESQTQTLGAIQQLVGALKPDPSAQLSPIQMMQMMQEQQNRGFELAKSLFDSKKPDGPDPITLKMMEKLERMEEKEKFSPIERSIETLAKSMEEASRRTKEEIEALKRDSRDGSMSNKLSEVVDTMKTFRALAGLEPTDNLFKVKESESATSLIKEIIQAAPAIMDRVTVAAKQPQVNAQQQQQQQQAALYQQQQLEIQRQRQLLAQQQRQLQARRQQSDAEFEDETPKKRKNPFARHAAAAQKQQQQQMPAQQVPQQSQPQVQQQQVQTTALAQQTNIPPVQPQLSQGQQLVEGSAQQQTVQQIGSLMYISPVFYKTPSGAVDILRTTNEMHENTVQSSLPNDVREVLKDLSRAPDNNRINVILILERLDAPMKAWADKLDQEFTQLGIPLEKNLPRSVMNTIDQLMAKSDYQTLGAFFSQITYMLGFGYLLPPEKIISLISLLANS